MQAYHVAGRENDYQEQETTEAQDRSYHYHLDVNMYDEKPELTLDLQHLHEISQDRLALLHRIYYLLEMSTEEGVVHIEREHSLTLIEAEERKRQLQMVPARSEQSIENDHVSHWLVLLGLSRSDDLQRFCLNQETRLFKVRLTRLKKNNLPEFTARLRAYADERYEHPSQELISLDDDFMKFEKEAAKRAGESEPPQRSLADFYAVPHTLTTLFSDRSVQVKAGYALLPLYKIQSLMLAEFREKLGKKLELAHKHFPGVVAKDPRMKELLLRMNDQYTGPDYSEHESRGMGGSGLKINLAELTSVANSADYPPCMKVLHKKLVSNHHLRHFGRLQYGLFLKGAGLTLKESLDFWKAELCKKMPIERFEREYAYNIRHAYGKEGKKVDYTPWSCDTILRRDPPVSENEHHGCPFKNYDAGKLLNVLDSYGVSAQEMTHIMKLKTGKEYQRACLHLFKYAHPQSMGENVGNHPVAFLQQSLADRKTGGTGASE